jgi:hypothetical protein
MKRFIRFPVVFCIGFLVISCQAEIAGEQAPLETNPPVSTPQVEESMTGEETSIVGELQQWAIAAEASSEFSVPEWSADQALGQPDSPGCGDYQFAWASAGSDSIETLILDYETPVVPLEIIVHQSFNPDQVVKVEVFDDQRGGFYTVLQKNPVQVDRPCPYQLRVPVEEIDFYTNRIRITIDQSQLGLGWNEIDAVQLIGSINPNP